MSRALEYAKHYSTQGWRVMPVPSGQKGPVREGWQRLRLAEEDLPQYFSDNENIGVLTGEPSMGLIDVDLDSSEARALAAEFLPQTRLRHGRPTSPSSHYWYRADPLPLTEKFRDPTARSGDDDNAMLVELRSTGCQTIVPPSLHPSGESCSWESEGEPAAIDGRILRRQVARLAACTLLARHWPGKGSRQEAALALAGALQRNGWEADESGSFIEAVARTARDEETQKWATAGEFTAHRLGADLSATGLPRLKELVDPRVVDRVVSWLGLRSIARDSAAGETDKPRPSSPVLINLSDVQREQVNWLWQERIPRGRLTGLMGDPGAGKSWLSLAVATAVTTGTPLPGETEGSEPTNVLLLTAEDGLADTVRPRLEDMGADLSRVKVLTAVCDEKGSEHHFSLVDDLAALETALATGGYALVIIDPLNAYVGSALDTHRDAAIRSVLTPLAALAERWKVAVLFILHLTKGKRDRAIYRGQGAIGYAAAARVVHLVGMNANDDRERAIVCVKNNLAPLPPALAFDINEGRFLWRGESTITAADLLAPDKDASEQTALREAMEFLREVLAQGPVDQTKVQQEALSLGITKSTLRRAKKAVKVESERVGGLGRDGYWIWSLSKMTNSSNMATLATLGEPDRNQARVDGGDGHLSTGLRPTDGLLVRFAVQQLGLPILGRHPSPKPCQDCGSAGDYTDGEVWWCEEHGPTWAIVPGDGRRR